MGKSIYFIESQLNEQLECLKSVQFQFGLVIGQAVDGGASTGDHVLHWCPVPSAEGEEPPSSLSELDPDTVAHHAAQVARMLPGGISVLGVYLACPKPPDASKTPQLRSLLPAVHRHTDAPYVAGLDVGAPPGGSQNVVTRMVVLTVSTDTLKYSCQSFSCTSPGALPEPVTVQIQKTSSPYQELVYSYSLNLSLYATADKSKEAAPLRSQLLEALRPWARRVCDSRVSVAGVLCGPTDTTPLRKRWQGEEKSNEQLQCHILERSCAADYDSCGIKGNKAGTSFAVTGTMAGRVFLHADCSAGYAVRAVLRDVLCSAYTRWSLHCDSLLTEDTNNAPSEVLHELPRRVHIKAPTLPVTVCDYLFPGDTADDACQSVQELLSLQVAPEDVCLDEETCPSLLSSEGSVLKEAVGGGGGSSSTRSSSGGSLALRPRHLQAAAALVLLAILIAYICLAR